jgi:hypothetical protein
VGRSPGLSRAFRSPDQTFRRSTPARAPTAKTKLASAGGALSNRVCSRRCLHARTPPPGVGSISGCEPRGCRLGVSNPAR